VNRVTLLDTGPLVAFLSARDHHHRWAVEILESLTGRVITCEAVLSEATFLIARAGQAHAVVLELIDRMGVVVHPMGEELRPLAHLMTKYASVPMSFADACLVRLAEVHSNSVVVTLDTDFHTYRRSNRRVVNTLMPG
jgi:predicted nucleic acid-binding protein